MTIEEVIDNAVMLEQTIEIEYCTRAGKVFTCEISDIKYSSYYGGGYIQAYRLDMREERTFKVSRIQKVNGSGGERTQEKPQKKSKPAPAEKWPACFFTSY